MKYAQRLVCRVRRVLKLTGTLCVLTALAGCGDGTSDAKHPDGGLPPLNIATEEKSDPDSERAQNGDKPSPAAHRQAEGAPPHKVGQQFPLLRTVEQTLTQSTPSGSLTSQSRFDVLLSVSVEKVQPEGRTRLGVHFERVRYVGDFAGQRVEYDSEHSESREWPRMGRAAGTPPRTSIAGASRPTGLTPRRFPSSPGDAALAWYQGLADNGFSFWMTPQDGVTELVGFEDFLKRCGPNGYVNDQEAALSRWQGISHSKGASSFVEQSVGLLPIPVQVDESGSPPQAGDSWTATRHIRWPLPMAVTNRYTLKRLDDGIAEIELVGRIGPTTGRVESASRGPVGHQKNADGRVWIDVRRGRTFGTYLVRRGLALPVEARVEYDFDMGVRTANGVEFIQRKTIVSTIQDVSHRRTRQPRSTSGSAGSTSGQPSSSPKLSRSKEAGSLRTRR